MKDLTFIAEGNPDFFKGGLINLTKRRQASYVKIFHVSYQANSNLATEQDSVQGIEGVEQASYLNIFHVGYQANTSLAPEQAFDQGIEGWGLAR